MGKLGKSSTGRTRFSWCNLCFWGYPRINKVKRVCLAIVSFEDKWKAWLKNKMTSASLTKEVSVNSRRVATIGMRGGVGFQFGWRKLIFLPWSSHVNSESYSIKIFKGMWKKNYLFLCYRPPKCPIAWECLTLNSIKFSGQKGNFRIVSSSPSTGFTWYLIDRNYW